MPCVYQGSLLTGRAVQYLFGDFGTSFGTPSGKLLMMARDGTISRLTLGLNDRGLGGWVKGFGQDAAGEVYVCTSDQLAPTGSGGKVWKLIPLVHVNAVEKTDDNTLRIEILADEDGGEVSLRRSTDLSGFPDQVPLSPLAHSLFEASVPIASPREFYRAELNP